MNDIISFETHLSGLLKMHGMEDGDVEMVMIDTKANASGLSGRDWRGPYDAPEVSGMRFNLIWKLAEIRAIKLLENIGDKRTSEQNRALETLKAPL